MKISTWNNEKQLFNTNNPDDSSSAYLSWLKKLQNSKSRFSDRHLMKVYGITVLIVTLLYIIIQASFGFPCDWNTELGVTNLIASITALSFLIYFTVKIFKLEFDFFQLKLEFLMTSALYIILLILVICYNTVTSYTSELNIVLNAIIIFPYLLLHIVVIVIPVTKAYLKKEFELQPLGLDSIISNEKLFLMLKKHMEKEYSIENLLFYIDIKQVLAHTDNNIPEKKLDEKLQRIGELYLYDNAPLLINLDESLYNKATNAISKRDLNYFEELHKTIYDIISTDTFPRFFRSQEVKLYMKNLNNANATLQQLN